MADQLYGKNYEIDIGELLAIFWFHKTLITVVTAVSVFIAGYYVLKTEKLYTAQAIFTVQTGNQNNFNLNNELGALASLAGFGSEVILTEQMLFWNDLCPVNLY